MSLHFGGGTGDHVDFAVGGAANLGNGAFTIVTLWKFAGNTGLLAGLNGVTERQGVLLSPGLFGTGDFSSGFGSPVSGDWFWFALSKPAGSAHYRGHLKDFTTSGAWSHGEAAGAANHSDPGVSDSIRVAAIPSTAASQGDVAVSAVFTAALSDAAIEAACTAALADLVAASPAWAVRFQQSAPTSIQDLIGSGHETGRTGTITASADPPGFDFSLGSDITLAGTLPALTGSFTVDANNDVQAAGSLPALAGAFAVDAASDLALAGQLPAFTAALTVGALSNVTLAGTLPAFVGYFTDGSDISKGVGRRAIARTPLGRPVQATPVGRSVP